MLEDFLKNAGIEQVTDLHPSSNRIFSQRALDYYWLETVVTPMFEIFGEKADASTTKKGKVGYIIAQGLTTAAGVVPYVGAEVASRVTESGLRGVGRLAKFVAGKIYDQLNKTDNESLRVVDDLIHAYESAKAEFGNKLEPRGRWRWDLAKDIGMVSLSLILATSAVIKTGEIIIGDGGEDDRRGSQVEPREPYPPQQLPPPVVFEPEPIPLADLDEFNQQKVLIYCANDGEKQYALDSLRERSRLRSASKKMNFRNVGGGVTKVTYRGAGDVPIEMHVVTSTNGIPDNDYSVVQVRGHTWDMAPLAGEVNGHTDDHVIYFFGGCNSNGLAAGLADENTAVIGGDGIQNGASNGYLLVRMLDEMGRTDEWSTLRANIQAQSQVAGTFTWPGDSNYVR
ncbi:hypothetical protein HOD38_06060 [archaeon]|jgi:hypothetical protein|nr:hypothetical protein [archaeon]MBT4397802.1 hypothetical protein [archaeon]MBT4441136.1 hypothetical protein [archaeon]